MKANNGKGNNPSRDEWKTLSIIIKRIELMIILNLSITYAISVVGIIVFTHTSYFQMMIIFIAFALYTIPSLTFYAWSWNNLCTDMKNLNVIHKKIKPHKVRNF